MTESSGKIVEASEAKAGPLPTIIDDARKTPRFYLKTRAEAVIHRVDGGQAQTTKYYLLTSDLSRGGVGLIHTDQLLPGQRLDIFLNDRPPLAAVVKWCSRVTDKCFAVGCKFNSCGQG